MTSIFPDASANGVVIRDIDGNPVVASNVENAYVPDPAFEMTCEVRALPTDCFSVIQPSQVNAIVSEMLCLAQTFSPTGVWDCASLCNLSEAFNTWVAGFAGGGGGDVCLSAVSDGTEVDAALIYCDGAGNTLKFPISGPDSLIEMFLNEICATATAGNADNSLDTLLYCDSTGALRSVSAFEFQLFRGEWVQAYGYSTNQMVRREGRLWSPNVAIAPGTAFVEGSAGATWYEVSPSTTTPYDPALGYPQDTIISRNGSYYAANDDIPPGTPFAIGTTGATWREVDFSEAFINEFVDTKNYTQNTVVTLDGHIYRATDGNVSAGAFDPADWELIAEVNKYKGVWVITPAYLEDDLVIQNNQLYAANADIPAGTAFVEGTVGATWRAVGSTAANIVEFSNVTAYVAGDTRSYQGGIYRAIGAVAPGPFNPTEWERLGGERNIYRGTWVLANAYNTDDVVLNTDQLYVANSNIPGGTPFTVGIAGATWRPIAFANDPIVEDFNIAAPYSAYELTINGSGIDGTPAVWRTKVTGHAPGPFSEVDFDAVGERSKFRGLKQPRSYILNDLVFGSFSQGGAYNVSELYRALGTIPDSNTDVPYDSADFEPVTKMRGVHNTQFRYIEGDIVVNEYGVWRANDDIAAATALTVGLTGATWSSFTNVRVITVTLGAVPILASYWNAYLVLDFAGVKTITVPDNASIPFPIGTTISGHSQGGQATIAAAGGVTVNTPDGLNLRDVDFAAFTLVKLGTNSWVLSGDLE